MSELGRDGDSYNQCSMKHTFSVGTISTQGDNFCCGVKNILHFLCMKQRHNIVYKQIISISMVLVFHGEGDKKGKKSLKRLTAYGWVMIKKKVKNQDPRATRQTGRAPAEPHCLGNIPLSLWCPSPRIPEVGLDGPGLHPALLHSCWPFLQAAETCMKSFVCLTLPSIPIFRQIFLFS